MTETLASFLKKHSYVKKGISYPRYVTHCNKCGSNEFTKASIDSKCFFCNAGIMRLVK